MAKLEAKFNTRFNKWLKENPIVGAFELKQTDLSFPYSHLAEHQELALLNVKKNTLIFKIPDLGYQNPFDCFCFHKNEAYVVILFQRSKKFYMIDIEVFVNHRNNSDRKSMTEEEASQIAKITI